MTACDNADEIHACVLLGGGHGRALWRLYCKPPVKASLSTALAQLKSRLIAWSVHQPHQVPVLSWAKT
jgi:hypothetical protein